MNCDPPAYIWPRTLRLSPRPPKLVYLDLNHWISLAKAITGHPGGEPYRETLAACIDAVDGGSALFPISDSIYFEISKIKQHRQRRDLREVIERVSRYLVVTSRPIIASHEMESLLDRLVGPNPRPINGMNYLDWGVARAFGMVGGFRVRSKDGEDVTEKVRLRHPDGPEAFDQVLAKADFEFNRSVIEGPRPEEEQELRRLGYGTTALFEVAHRRAEQEIEQVGRLESNPEWRRGRLRDVVAARELIIEINDPLTRGLSDRGVALQELFPQSGDARGAFDAMPSFDVAVSLKTAYHRNPSHRWTPNDIHDIDALGSTLPYCDIVATDKMAAHVSGGGMAERLRTTVLSSLSDLLRYL